MNCRYISLIFTQILLAAGFKARWVSCLHCVSEVYIEEYRKWIVVDVALNVLYFDKKGNKVRMKKLTIFSELLHYAWKRHKSLVFVIVFKNIFSATLPLINVVGIGVIIDALMNELSNKAVMKIIFLFTALNLGVSLIKYVLTYLQNIVERKASDKIQYDYMRDAIIVNYHWAQDGSVLDMKKKSMGANPVFVFSYIGNLIDYIVKFAGILFIFSILSPLFIIIISATSAISIIITFKIRKLDFEFENERTEDSRKLDYLYNLMTRYEYAKEVRINNLKPLIIHKNTGIIATQLVKLKAFMRLKLRFDSLSAVIAAVQSVIMYLYFSYRVNIGSLTIADYSVLLGAVALLTSILIGFFDNIAVIDRLTARMDIFLKYKKWMRENSCIFASNEMPQTVIDKKHNQINFENVSFVYPNTDIPILRNLNFVLRDGEKVGIVGLNGSGKTTLVKLLLRLYTPTQGKILLNGIDINTIPLEQYLKRIGAVLQDFNIFAYSIKENIVFDNNVNEDVINNAIKKSGFAGKVASLKDGVDTILYKELDENGIELSGGEGQKLALARALCKDTGILILDEPTSTLDPIAEYEMFSGLHDISEGKTTIFISHRLSSTKFCDRIFVIQDGVIAEEGSHSELMAQGGLYADMFESQAKVYRENGVVL